MTEATGVALDLQRCAWTDMQRGWCVCPDCLPIRPVRRAADMPQETLGRTLSVVNPSRYTNTYGTPQRLPERLTGPLCRVPSCQKQAGDAFVCPNCIEELEVALADAAALLEDLDIAARKQAKVRSWGTLRSAPDPEHLIWEVLDASEALRILGRTRPDMPRMADLADTYTAEIATAVRAITDRHGRTYDGPTDTPTVALWLIRHSASVALSPDGPSITQGIISAHFRALVAIDNAPDRPYVGPCKQCARPMHAKPGAEIHLCLYCNAPHSVKDLKDDVLQKVRDHLAPVTDLVTLAKIAGHTISKRRVRYLIESNRLTRKGRDAKGVDLYRMGDFLTLIDADAA